MSEKKSKHTGPAAKQPRAIASHGEMVHVAGGGVSLKRKRGAPLGIAADSLRLRALVAELSRRALSESKVKIPVMSVTGPMMKVSIGADGKPRIEDVPDVKTMQPDRPLLSSKQMAASMFGMRPIRTVLVYAPSVDSSSANTSNAPVHNLDPVQSGEWSSFAALFDECRVLHTRSECWISISTATAVVTTFPLWCVCFDPDISGQQSSIADTASHTRHAGPFAIYGPVMGSAPANSATTVYSGTGTQQVAGVVLTSGPLMKSVLPLNNGGTLQPNPVQGDWFPTTSSTAQAGYVKFYADAIGTAGITTIRAVHYLTVEFRMRG